MLRRKRHTRESGMFQVTRELRFCYGHRLLDYDGVCKHPHGHNAKVEIEVRTAQLDHRNMVCDFSDIKRIVKGWIDRELDHKMILRHDDPLVPLLQSAGGDVGPYEQITGIAFFAIDPKDERNRVIVDLDLAKRLVTARTRALLLQHTFGTPADIDCALEFGRRHGVAVVEDCVHALGASHRGQPVGSFGNAAFFSTEETKTISSTMGGMAVTDDAELAAKLRVFQARCAPPSRALVGRYVLKLVGVRARAKYVVFLSFRGGFLG